MTTVQARVHLADCTCCGKRIAWSRKRKRWLALAPAAAPTQLQRRLACTAGFHRPDIVSLAERAWRDYLTAGRAAA